MGSFRLQCTMREESKHGAVGDLTASRIPRLFRFEKPLFRTNTNPPVCGETEKLGPQRSGSEYWFASPERQPVPSCRLPLQLLHSVARRRVFAPKKTRFLGNAKAHTLAKNRPRRKRQSVTPSVLKRNRKGIERLGTEIYLERNTVYVSLLSVPSPLKPDAIERSLE